ncbi:MAG TPA: nitroreductase family protein [Chloroflexota bacterium]|nr:nitroreductase family protein [Chloroflexota bacterium]
MSLLPLTPDDVLATTRAVRRRLDFDRPVERALIEECLSLAQQAPRASNVERRAFVVVTDAEKRGALAEIWRRGMERYLGHVAAGVSLEGEPRTSQERIFSGVRYLGEHLQEVPVHVIPCVRGRLDGRTTLAQSGLWGSIGPATWSFMLAARARGLGTCWTTFHLIHEEEAAEILEIPYHEVSQIALIPVAYTRGTEFRPAPREPLETVVHWDGW